MNPSQADFDRFNQMVSSGNNWGAGQLAASFGFSPQDVAGYVNQNHGTNHSAADVGSYMATPMPKPQVQMSGTQQLSPGMDPMEAYRIAQRQGMNMNQIADQMGVSRADVSNWLTDNKLPLNTPGAINSIINYNQQQFGRGPDDIAHALWQASHGKSVEEISLQTGYSPAEIRDFLTRHNLGPTSPGIKDYHAGLAKFVPDGGSPFLTNKNEFTGQWNGNPLFNPAQYADRNSAVGAFGLIPGGRESWGSSYGNQPNQNSGTVIAPNDFNAGQSQPAGTAPSQAAANNGYMTTPRTFNKQNLGMNNSVAQRRGWGGGYFA